MEAINENESLFDLVRMKKQINGKILIAQFSGKSNEVLKLKGERIKIDQKILELETAAQKEGSVIRIM
ncbi:MAG: hypothetical protein PHU54_09310 [Candidatus Omnitrophica bacterium]|nr:hypothetical protein [Candidatus Omnitrophota bacterium]